MTFDANTETLPAMFAYIEEMISQATVESADFENIAYNTKLACEEILVNIANYAYPTGDGHLDVEWKNDISKREVRVKFTDAGVPFDPLEKSKPALDVPMAERKIGGLGIMMVRKVMDAVEYAHMDGKNILTLTKRY